MKIPKIEIEITEDHLSNIITDLNVIPYPCVIYIPESQDIHLNLYAAELLELKEKHITDLNRIITLNPHLQALFYKDTYSNVTTFRKIRIKLVSGKSEVINIRSQLLKDKQNKDTFILFLSKADKDAVNPIFSLYLIKKEIAELKPFLNHTGATKLENIIINYFSEKSKTLILEDMIAYEEELQAIQKQFPKLSAREVLLCVLLYNTLSLTEIAKLMGRTQNSVSVTIHRINQKLQLTNKNELIMKLQEVINENNKTK